MENKLTIEIKEPNDINEAIDFTSDKMRLLYSFLHADYTFLSSFAKEIKNDIENDNHPGFSFLNTKLIVKDYYFILKYNIFFDMDEEEEEAISKINLVALQSEFFRLADEYNELNKKNRWKKIEITFDGKLFDLKVIEEFSPNSTSDIIKQ